MSRRTSKVLAIVISAALAMGVTAMSEQHNFDSILFFSFGIILAMLCIWETFR